MDPFSIAALLGAGASILSGFLGSNAANQASQTQAAASDKATALQAATIAQARQDAAPWLAAGNTALQQYMGELGLSKTVTAPGTTTPAVYDSKGKLVTAATTTPGTTTPFVSQFAETPNYAFDVSQGTKGVINNLAALGMKDSGAALKALTRYTTGAANDTYQSYLDRLSGVSTGGQTQENATSALGQTAANNIATGINNTAAATASGYVGSATALGAGLTGATNNLTTALGWGF